MPPPLSLESLLVPSTRMVLGSMIPSIHLPPPPTGRGGDPCLFEAHEGKLRRAGQVPSPAPWRRLRFHHDTGGERPKKHHVAEDTNECPPLPLGRILTSRSPPPVVVGQASRLAEGRYLMLLNNDVMMTPGALRALYSAVRDVPSVGVAVPQFIQVCALGRCRRASVRPIFSYFYWLGAHWGREKEWS